MGVGAFYPAVTEELLTQGAFWGGWGVVFPPLARLALDQWGQFLSPIAWGELEKSLHPLQAGRSELDVFLK